MKLVPCIKCKSKDISTYDCGYSSFNYGGAICDACGREVLGMVGCLPTEAELVKIWNKENDAKILIKEEKRKIKEAEKKISKLEKAEKEYGWNKHDAKIRRAVKEFDKD